MKKTFLLVLVTLISLPNWAAGAGRTNDTTLSKIFPVSKGAYYTINVTGANARIIRTKGAQIKIDMMDTGRYEPKDEKVANYSLNAEKTGNDIKVQVISNPTSGSTKGGIMHLVISIPRTIGFRLESKNNLTFGEGFPDMHGNYSGTVNMHAEDQR
jgi:hypothetical protein